MTPSHERRVRAALSQRGYKDIRLLAGDLLADVQEEQNGETVSFTWVVRATPSVELRLPVRDALVERAQTFGWVPVHAFVQRSGPVLFTVLA